jgi:hypothetical protein
VEFACLFFDTDDVVRSADTINAVSKREALDAAFAHLRAMPDLVGFQLWRHGVKIAEHFVSEDVHRGRARADNDAEAAVPSEADASDQKSGRSGRYH